MGWKLKRRTPFFLFIWHHAVRWVCMRSIETTKQNGEYIKLVLVTIFGAHSSLKISYKWRLCGRGRKYFSSPLSSSASCTLSTFLQLVIIICNGNIIIVALHWANSRCHEAARLDQTRDFALLLSSALGPGALLYGPRAASCVPLAT